MRQEVELHQDEVVGGVGVDGGEVGGGAEESYRGQSGAKDFTGDYFEIIIFCLFGLWSMVWGVLAGPPDPQSIDFRF